MVKPVARTLWHDVLGRKKSYPPKRSRCPPAKNSSDSVQEPYMHASEYMLYMDSRIYGAPPIPEPKERRMSRKTMKITGAVVVLALWSGRARPLGGNVQPPRSRPPPAPARRPSQKAAKDNKYLFIFFWREDTQHSRVMRGVFQAAMAKMADKAQTVEIQVADAAEAADRGPLRRQPLAHAAGVGHRPQRRHHQGPGHAVRRGPASAGLCQPVHGRVHEGPPGAQARALVRPAGAAAGQAGAAAPERPRFHRR